MCPLYYFPLSFGVQGVEIRLLVSLPSYLAWNKSMLLIYLFCYRSGPKMSKQVPVQHCLRRRFMSNRLDKGDYEAFQINKGSLSVVSHLLCEEGFTCIYNSMYNVASFNMDMNRFNKIELTLLCPLLLYSCLKWC